MSESPINAAGVILQILLCISGCGQSIVQADASSVADGAPESLQLKAQATNQLPTFRQYLYSFPLASRAEIISLSGSVSFLSEGQGFAEALVSIDDVPSGGSCPVNGESFDSYPDIRAHYRGLRTLARFIIKAPLGSRASSMLTNVRFPEPIAVGQCLIIILDGAVLRVGGPFTMLSNIVANIAFDNATVTSVTLLDVDDELCFDREDGCQLATREVSPRIAFMKVVPIKESGVLLALYGDISDSGFGWGGTAAQRGQWTIDNAYYLFPTCSLTEGLHGPDNYFAHIPANARQLLAAKMTGNGRSSLQQPVYQVFGIPLKVGNCLVHLVRVNAAQKLGGVDAESQIMALVESNAKY